jgi:hypothetical protein
MRTSSGAITDIRRHFVTTLTTDSTCPSRAGVTAEGRPLRATRTARDRDGDSPS